MLSYYDKIVGAIAVSLLSGLLLGVLTSIAFHIGVFLGALTATVFMLDALFRNPPLPVSDPRVAATAFIWLGFLVSLVSLILIYNGSVALLVLFGLVAI